MTLSVTVLGGSAAWPNPGQGCSSYLVRTGGASLLLDCGPDTLLELRRHAELDGIDAIVVSHCHSDHILDLVTYRYALVYGVGERRRRVPIWLPPGGSDILGALGDALGSQGEDQDDFWGEVFELIEYEPDRVLALPEVRLTFAPTQHFTTCYAMRLESSDGKSVVYGADTGSVGSLVGFASGADLLISEATADDYGELAEHERGHLTPEDAGRWASRSGAHRLLITHLWHERSPMSVVERARAHFQGPIDVAARGLTVYV